MCLQLVGELTYDRHRGFAAFRLGFVHSSRRIDGSISAAIMASRYGVFAVWALSFTFTDPAWAGQTLSSTGLVDHGVDNARLPALPAELTGFFFAPAEVGAPDNVFSISGTGFIYGRATIVGIDFTHDGIRYPRARHGR